MSRLQPEMDGLPCATRAVCQEGSSHTAQCLARIVSTPGSAPVLHTQPRPEPCVVPAKASDCKELAWENILGCTQTLE